MAKIVFRLNGVSEEEADEVRQLLEDRGFETYETTAGRWGVSMAAIWLVNNDDKPAARAAIEDYQAERQARLRAEYETARAEGRVPRMRDRLRAEPLKALVVVAGILVVAGLSLIPFFRFG